MPLSRALRGISDRDSSGGASGDESADLQGGQTVISDSVVAKVAGVAARGVTGVHSLGSAPARAFGAIREALSGTDLSQGVSVTVGDSDVVIDIVIVAEYPTPVQQIAADVRASITRAIEGFLGLGVSAVNVTINDVHHPSEDDQTSRATASGTPRETPRESDNTMSASDKIKNTAEDLKGKANEAIGKATNDDSKVAEGRAEQASASAKKAGENIKDVFKD
jgi:uncharacterized alkaline shock family protein YloU/uncharacterized protein YjbJ (UPF0337 family)